ncbi:MAG: biotin--[acetyl-CoA-carboxylase] ligase [Lachnospiraceae bacterium]|nr:biotin--[acetyl-CoA-carboxylase] ligase [Lachnospiraceae bacterium]
MEADIKVYDSVSSTNTVLSELAAKGAGEGTCVIASSQSAGQGRSGRTFYSPSGGNLYMSLLLRPYDIECSMITVTAAVAVVKAIKNVLGLDAGIKWVNDIIFKGRKVCGIIATAHSLGSEDMHVILGIGMNIFDAADVPEDIRESYGSLMGKKCDISPKEQKKLSLRLAKEIIREFAVRYENPVGLSVVDEYRRFCTVIGKKVIYFSGVTEKEGYVLGIDDDGGIIIETDGETESYRDGEIRIKPEQAILHK